MSTDSFSEHSPTVRAAWVGFGLIACYAVVGALQILVWNPLAAVPGSTLTEIRAQLAGVNESTGTALVVVWAATGILLGAGVLVAALRRNISAVGATRLPLAIIVLGAPSMMIASFPAGMGLADTFGISGGDHAPWGALLYLVSAVALILLAFVLVRARPKPPRVSPM